MATAFAPHGLQMLALQGLQGLQGLHGLQAFAAQGLQGLHGLQGFAAQGLQGFTASLAAATGSTEATLLSQPLITRPVANIPPMTAT